MSRYIDAGAFESALLKEYDKAVGVEHNTLKMVFEILSTQPTEDVSPVVHGEWIDKGHDNTYKCSKCGDIWIGVGGYNYCPNCGARMDGAK